MYPSQPDKDEKFVDLIWLEPYPNQKEKLLDIAANGRIPSYLIGEFMEINEVPIYEYPHREKTDKDQEKVEGTMDKLHEIFGSEMKGWYTSVIENTISPIPTEDDRQWNDPKVRISVIREQDVYPDAKKPLISKIVYEDFLGTRRICTN